MAWDFSTDPQYEEQLAWMRGFVREEIFPFETLDLDHEQILAAMRPLQDQVKARGLWAAHLPPDLGGMGFGQVKLGLMHEILGQSMYGPVVFGNNAPDSGNAELLAAGMEMTGREDIRERWLTPLLSGSIRSGFSMTEPNTAGSDPRLLKTRATKDGDEWVINGRKWYTTNGSVADILIVMAVTNPEVHPYQGSSMFVVPVRHTGSHDPARRGRDGPPRRASTGASAITRRSSTRTCACPPTTSSVPKAQASSWPRRASDRAASITACAGSASPSGPLT